MKMKLNIGRIYDRSPLCDMCLTVYRHPVWALWVVGHMWYLYSSSFHAFVNMHL